MLSRLIHLFAGSVDKPAFRPLLRVSAQTFSETADLLPVTLVDSLEERGRVEVFLGRAELIHWSKNAWLLDREL